MKTVVAVQDLLELEIKPDALLEEFVALTDRDVRERLVPRATQSVGCPACGSGASDAAFEKLGLVYRECRVCATLFVSPRPPQDVVDEYYRSAASSVFWRERVVPATGAARSEKIVWPRAQWVADGLAEHGPGARTGLDLSTGAGAFAAALARLAPSVHRTIPLAPEAAVAEADFAVAFDVLDRHVSPRALVGAVHRALRPGGLLFVIAPCISGFDLQTLWERSRTITPPDRINLLSLRGFRELFADGWEIRELSTPGMFDVETVRRAMLADPAAGWPRVLKRLLVESGPEVLADLQEFLQRHRLSSFARLLVQKKE